MHGSNLEYYLDQNAGTSLRAARKWMIPIAARLNEMRTGKEDAIMHSLEVARSGGGA